MSTTNSTAPETDAPEGPQTYTERRLLEIATAADKIAFWVRLWSILTVLAGLMYFVASLGRHY